MRTGTSWTKVFHGLKSNWRSSTLAVCFAIVVGYFLIHLGLLGFLVGPFDYDHLSGYYELAWRFWATGQSWVPQYNPFLCGGRTLAGDPQIPLFHPLVLLVPVFGPTWTLKVEMLAQLAAGASGLYWLLRRWGLRQESVLWGVFLFVSGGGVIARFLVGHVTLGFFFLFPLFLFLSYRLADLPAALKHRTRLAYWILFIYAALYKPNFLIHGAPLLAFEAIVRSLLSRQPGPAMEFGLALGMGAGANAFIYLPAGAFFKAFPRPPDSTPAITPFYTALLNLLMPLKSIPNWLYGERFLQRFEYNIFLGPVALIFAWIGWRKKNFGIRHQVWAVLGLILFSLFLGMGAPADDQVRPWLPFNWLIDWWPGFTSIRVPPRFWFGAYFGLVLLSALGYQSQKQGAGRFLIITLGVIPLTASALVNLTRISYGASSHQWSTPREYPTEVRFEKGDDGLSLSRLRAGTGVLECLDNLEAFRSSVVTPGNALASAASHPVEGRASWLGWSQIDLSFYSPRSVPGGTLSLNLNHSPLWQVEGDGVSIVSRKGAPLTFASTDGSFKAIASYRQPGIEWGMGISFAVMVLVIAYALWIGKKALYLRRSRGACYRVGLTGGLASGKGQVANYFRETGIAVVNLDQIGRELTEGSPTIQNHISFLTRSCDEELSMRELVFGHASLRASLEAYLHPRIWEAYFKEEKRLIAAGHRLIVCESALFVDAGKETLFDELVVVSAPESLRIQRAIERDGIGEELAFKMVRTQVTEEQRRQSADTILDNGESFEQLRQQTYQLMGHWRFKKLI